MANFRPAGGVNQQRSSEWNGHGEARPTRVCMLTHSFYETDNRVMRYAETLAQRGDAVEVFSIRSAPEVPKQEVINGVKVFRIQDRFKADAKTKRALLCPLLQFLVKSTYQLSRRHMLERYDVVHVHNMPDFLVFAAWYPKLTGARIILDVHDIVPELFANMFDVPPDSLWVSTLKLIEKWSARFAHHIILSNDLWRDKFTARAARTGKCSVFINHVDTNIFKPQPRTPRAKPIIIFPGSFHWHQGLDIAIHAFRKLHTRIPEAEFHIYGDGPMKSELVTLTKKLGLENSVRFFETLSLQEIAKVMAQADVGVVPKRADTFGDEAFSTKILEFMAVGVPVVASSTRIDRYYFNDSLVHFFPSGDSEAMAEAMYQLLTNRELRSRLVSQGTAHAAQNNWSSRKAEYLDLIDSLRAA